MKSRQLDLQESVEELLQEAKRQGASAAEAAVSSDAGLSVTVRLGETETIEHTRDNGLGVTVYFGHRKGSASTSDLSPQAIKETVEAACNFARYTSEDDCSGLADSSLMATELPDLDLYHPWNQSVEEAIELAIRCETAARETDDRIFNSEGATLNSHNGLQVYGNTHGFIGGYPSSRHSLSCAVLGKEGESMQRDYWYTLARKGGQLDSAESVGEMAAKRTVARLNGRRIKTQQAPVLFQSDVAVGLLRSFVGAIRGSSLYRKASFLLDQLGKPVFPAFINIHEDPLLSGGLASSAYDSEGVATSRKDFIQDGVLTSYVLDSYAARKLGMQTTGNGGGVRNLRISSGDQDKEGLLKSMQRGLLVTELMGQGVNMVTGDYSRGVTGFWIENGEIQFPVEEITIAGNMKEMFLGLQEVGSDIETRSSVQTGSWLIDNMMIAGE
ncbi:MAG: metalloprotease PmbA [Candidatus Thiodiazotropha weberae]|uniref:Metalloprotease PmbA n=1 Tax=Candidatus Thiodiazotropha endoloripes TaxID=1818881 RepID=A0A1E2UV06_9GAMM|nr:metalloprotease PmbA [Candidatus Thiodiazotropha endoloripes]MCG7900647.1 metalloprotease PmbA [Candidatus Thiodiazotropha weberae]MCG7991862.1 metalloprotease PmbA [Candidatus Thiodiazotropha lotti]MCG7901901.1 metalloprotease PmbA [Candidatus Thiodiazotropha weberae]MCW4183520.1 metalloprotease PmbA [Candidatus Thiodiazotropha weberae]ODB84817.1 metalloprotease PmbA [Candidatus Thiodiazotropha endoloripes]